MSQLTETQESQACCDLYAIVWWDQLVTNNMRNYERQVDIWE
jgi:hypothetical protein